MRDRSASAIRCPGCEVRRRRRYEPPRVESLSRLDRAVRFGGSNAVDSGSGLGHMPGAGPRRSSSRD